MKTSCIQMTSGPDIEGNLQNAAALIREAAGQGATFIATPENTDYIRRYAREKLEISGDENTHAPIAFFVNLAAELNVWLLIGSLGIKISDTQLANRSHLFSPQGKLVSRYDKIHMFDVKLSRSEFYNESTEYKAGNRAVIADMDGVRLGLGICYDIRFPHLFRDLAKGGAQILSAPAAFTVPTGKAHWEILLRARAIETGSFVITPAQVGEHEGGRQTYGHSMIINPWGEIIAEADGDQPAIITAEIDLDEVTKARQAIPALTHDREYEIEQN
jgi:predicted amidohydrolase